MHVKVKLSIIIPILNEQQNIEACWQNVRAALSDCEHDWEVIFVDGGSTDGSFNILQRIPCARLQSGAGRAMQMNLGASKSEGDVLLFLHVDTQLPKLSSTVIQAMLSAPWGYFKIKLSNSKWIYRCIATGINFRSRIFNVATGDQCIFVQKSLFDRVNGFAALPLMEDIELTRRLQKMTAPYCITDKVLSSSRRWEKHGALTTVLKMWSFQLAFRLGVPAEYLAKRY